jgi:hypothetical protein
MISHQCMWDTKPIHDILHHETDHLTMCHVFQWYCFHPLCKVVSCHKNKPMPLGSRWVHLSYEIQEPSSKRPRFYYGMQGTCRCHFYFAEPLARLTSLIIHKAILEHIRPIQPYPLQHPFHFVCSLMRATHSLVHLPHGNFLFFFT